MQISQKDIEETIDYIVNNFRRQSLEASNEEYLRHDFSFASLSLHGLHLLFMAVDCCLILDLIKTAEDDLVQLRDSALFRIKNQNAELSLKEAA